MENTYEFLRKCHGLRFRATLMNKPQEGVIKVTSEGVMLCYGEEDSGYLVTFGRRDTLSFSKQTFAVLPSDFEIVPRDPETYMDWQVGDKVCEDEHRNALYEVIFRSGELVFFKDWNNWACNPMTCSEAFTRFGMRLVLTDIEKQIIEEKQKAEWEPQDGDVCYLENNNIWIFVKKKYDTPFDNAFYVSYCLERDRIYYEGNIMNGKPLELRPATDEEKQRLFDALAKNGKRWNAEKKVIEDIASESDEPVNAAEPTFKKFDPVLVRRGIYDTWRPAVFKRYGDANECPYITVGGYGFQDCVPLNEDTEQLICTTNLYSEGK